MHYLDHNATSPLRPESLSAVTHAVGVGGNPSSIHASGRAARAIMDEADLARLVKEQARAGDMVVCLGAGTISAWANALPAKLMGQAA